MPEASDFHQFLQAAIVETSQAEHEIVTRQREVGVSQGGMPPIVYSTKTQILDASRAHTDTSPRHLISLIPVVDLNDNHISGGVSLDGYESGQRNYRDESNIWKPQGGHVPSGNEQQRHVLTYPPGEVDAVRITDMDMESLQPESWLRDNIIDFYIMYLERNRLSSVYKDHVYFFNSFFFTKLVESTAQGKIGYEQVRNWTKDVNLFEKKYIFIPVNQSSHWSLIIICNLASSSYEHITSPYILHLDSLKDRCLHDVVEIYNRNDHVETYIRQYIIEAWKEKYHAGSDVRLGSLCSMKFVQAEVPQQDNGYDCGIYLLHYIERFLKKLEFSWNFESALMDHGLLTNGIPGIWFESSEVFMKRKEIEYIIKSLSQWDKGAQGAATRPAHDQTVVKLAVHNREGLPVTSLSRPRRDKRKRDSNWTDEETSILVKCKKEAAVDNGSQFCKGKSDVTNWYTIAEEINSNLGTMSIPKTGDQCRLRWDTLVKSYQKIKEHCRRSNKGFSELTRKERVELKLATTLSKVQWYEVIDQFCPPKSRKSKAQKLDNVAPNVDILPWSLHNSTHSNSPMQIGIGSFEARESSTKEVGALQDIPGFSTMSSELIPVASDPPVQIEIGSLEPQEPPGKEVGLAQVIPGWSVMNGDLNQVGFGSQVPIQSPDSEPRKSSRKQVAIPRFNSMSQGLRSTILNLVQAWPTFSTLTKMEKVCRWLAIVQNRSPSETHSSVVMLLSRKLLTISNRFEEKCILKLSHLRVYKKFVKVAISKNLDYNIHNRILQNHSMLSFESSSVPQRIQVLTLYKCANLKRVDLGKLPMLRSLSIMCCCNLKKILGWETLSELGWLEIRGCGSYHEHLRVHCLPSLKEFFLLGYDSQWDHSTGFNLDFSQCVRLRKVRIGGSKHMAKSVDLSTLKYLEELSFSYAALESLVGFSELHSLTKVKFSNCRGLKRLPYLGHLKALAKLNLSYSSIETITGFENLHSLTHLTLWDCSALKRSLPDLGGLKALVYLCIRYTDVDEIRGLEKLHSLTHLDLERCKALKRLPYLGHMKSLTHLDISHSGVDEIPGVRELANLKRLHCSGSQLEWLPDLSHLPRLKRVYLYDTPLVRVPSSKYFEKRVVDFNEGVKWADEVADVSDADYVPSDQELYDEHHLSSESSDVNDSDY